MHAYLRKFKDDAQDRGATAVEYGLLVAAIAAVIVAIVFGLGSLVQGVFESTSTEIGTNIDGGGGDAPPDGGAG